MEGEADIYAQIVTDPARSAVFFEELVCMGRKPEEIRRGIDAARSQIEATAVAPAINSVPRHSGFGGNPCRDAS